MEMRKMQEMQTRNSFRMERGSIMFETLIGVVIFAIGIVGLISSFLVSTKFSGENRYRTEAVAIANELLGEMSVSDSGTLSTEFAGNAARFTAWVQKRVRTLPNGAASIDFPAVGSGKGTQVTLTVTWRPFNEIGGTQGGSYSTSTYFR